MLSAASSWTASHNPATRSDGSSETGFRRVISSFRHSIIVRNLNPFETWIKRLSTVVLKTDGTLATNTVGPEATEVNVGLGHIGVGDEKPDTEDGLGEDVKDSVGNDLGVDRELARAVGNTPDTAKVSTG